MDESEKWKGSCSVVSDSSRPHGLQLSRLLHPWHFPGKSTGVGCHCLLRNSSLKTLYYLAFVCSLCSSLVTLLSAPALLACLFFLEHWASSDPGPLLLPFLCLEIISFIFFFLWCHLLSNYLSQLPLKFKQAGSVTPIIIFHLFCFPHNGCGTLKGW